MKDAKLPTTSTPFLGLWRTEEEAGRQSANPSSLRTSSRRPDSRRNVPALPLTLKEYRFHTRPANSLGRTLLAHVQGPLPRLQFPEGASTIATAIAKESIDGMQAKRRARFLHLGRRRVRRLDEPRSLMPMSLYVGHHAIIGFRFMPTRWATIRNTLTIYASIEVP